jgi:hypothetical protein
VARVCCEGSLDSRAGLAEAASCSRSARSSHSPQGLAAVASGAAFFRVREILWGGLGLRSPTTPPTSGWTQGSRSSPACRTSASGRPGGLYGRRSPCREKAAGAQGVRQRFPTGTASARERSPPACEERKGLYGCCLYRSKLVRGGCRGTVGRSVGVSRRTRIVWIGIGVSSRFRVVILSFPKQRSKVGFLCCLCTHQRVHPSL